MTDAQLIAAHIAKHGITHRPPMTHALPAVEGWQDMTNRQHAIARRVRRFKAARRRAQAGKETAA